MGISVTRRIRQIRQPKAGFVDPKELDEVSLGSGEEELNPYENIHPTLVGTAVDYLTRYMSGASVTEAFKISINGAFWIGKRKFAESLLENINKHLDDASIISATKLSGFDEVSRGGRYKPVEEINPDAPTISNIRTMVKRSLDFLKKYGPKVLDGFTFEGGYTSTVSAGDGDFTTKDTLWDFKVSKYPPIKEYTLQILMYWIMGIHSIHPEFKSIKYLGIYNPRLNKVYRKKISDIPNEVISEVETQVIGY